MQRNSLKNKIGGAILGISLMLGIGFASSVTTQAQYQNGQWSRQQQRQIERERLRRQREYEREQLRRQRAAQRGGYGNDGYGNGGYRNDGYGNGGYRNDGYGNYGNAGASYELRQTALNAGYNEGNKAGRNDRSRGRGFSYADEGAYRDASKDYNSRYGDRGLYQQYFRQAFVNGYTDGYRGY